MSSLIAGSSSIIEKIFQIHSGDGKLPLVRRGQRRGFDDTGNCRFIVRININRVCAISVMQHAGQIFDFAKAVVSIVCAPSCAALSIRSASGLLSKIGIFG